MTIDTACSSSMYAVHFAVNAIRNGDCESAIVGGSNLITAPEMQLLTVKLGALSPTSTCHTFDSSADGYGRGEGVCALYLKKYSEAVAGGYPIRGIIRGTAVNAYVAKCAMVKHALISL
jgi:acyl transferase domain-containing protein